MASRVQKFNTSVLTVESAKEKMFAVSPFMSSISPIGAVRKSKILGVV